MELHHLSLSKLISYFCAPPYLKFLRFAGVDRADPVIDSKRFDGPLHEPMRRLDRVRLSLIRSTVEIGPERAALNRATCPLDAKQLVRNAVLYRFYESSDAPVQLYWSSDRIEIINPGGPYRDASQETFSRPGLVSCRNPSLAKTVRELGLVQRFGAAIPLARGALRENGQSRPEIRSALPTRGMHSSDTA